MRVMFAALAAISCRRAVSEAGQNNKSVLQLAHWSMLSNIAASVIPPVHRSIPEAAPRAYDGFFKLSACSKWLHAG